MPTHTSRPDFLAWIARAKPGDRTAYHIGWLMHDREDGAKFIEVNATACAAWDKMEAGEVILTQAKIGLGVYEYRATKLAAPFKPVVWLGPYATDKYTKYQKPPGSRRTPDERAAFKVGCALGHDKPIGRPHAPSVPVGLEKHAA